MTTFAIKTAGHHVTAPQLYNHNHPIAPMHAQKAVMYM